MTQFQGDALWGPCPNGGTIEFANGAVVRSGGLFGAVYISLMGGNHLDDGTPGSRETWWGNHTESDPNKHIIGRTETLLAGLPMTSSNLNRVIEAVKQDLAWMVTLGVATSVSAAAGIEAAQRIRIEVTVESDNNVETFIFRPNWVVGPSESQLAC